MPTKTQTRTIAEAAHAAIPGYAEAKTAVDTLARWRANRPAFATVADPLDDMRAAARTGAETAPEDIGARLIATEQAVINYQRTSAAILNEHSAARSELNTLVTQGADYALEYLHGEILKRQDTIRRAGEDLVGVSSAAQAMLDPAHREAWAQLASTVRDVDEIRTTQWSLYRELVQDWPGNKAKLASIAFLTNALDYEPALVAYRTQQARRMRPDRFPEVEAHATWLTATPTNPWNETDIHGQPWWPTDDHAAYLLWATRVTGLWVPTVDQIQEAHEAAIAASLDVGNGGDSWRSTYRDGEPTKKREQAIPADLARARQARERYYAITGGTPTSEKPAISDAFD